MNKEYLAVLMCFPVLTLKNGENISIQASSFHEGCSPRSNEPPYTHVEVNLGGEWCSGPKSLWTIARERGWNPKNGLPGTFEFVQIGQVFEVVEQIGVHWEDTFNRHVAFRKTELGL